jgi:hypothetical protein
MNDHRAGVIDRLASRRVYIHLGNWDAKQRSGIVDGVVNGVIGSLPASQAYTEGRLSP